MVTTKRKLVKRKSVVLDTNVEGGEETEVAAHITVPSESPWAWVVLTTGFFVLFIIDGCCYSYGALLPEILKTIKVESSLGALINAVEVSMYYFVSPIASALINRFGFRTVGIIGSLICCFGLFGAYCSDSFISLLLFMGFVTGAGISFLGMVSSLIVGFYFEKRRAFAMALVTTGTSVGTIVMYPLCTELVKKSGWKNTILVHASLHGLVYFLSLTFRPLVSLTVTHTEENGNPMRTIAYLPTITSEQGTEEGTQSSATERMLQAVSNKNFPTAADFFKEPLFVEEDKNTEQQKPSTSAKSTSTSRITSQIQEMASKNKTKQVQSMVSKSKMQDSETKIPRTEITDQTEKQEEKSGLASLLHWKPEPPEARPMYRDDAFYEGNVEDLPVHRKSMAAVKEEDRTGFEYQLAVSRAIRVDDLQERNGICTIAFRRVIVTMMDPALLKKKSFLVFCLSGFLCSAGILVPYIYLADRNAQAGIDKKHCKLFISVLAFANLIGRIMFSLISSKVQPVYLFAFGLLASGISTILSGLSYTAAYQYGYSAVYGLFVSTNSGLRSIIIVNLYGLEHLTNATGVVLLSIGFGNLISTPLAGFIKQRYGYQIAFYVAGSFLVAGGMVGFTIKTIRNSETKLTEKEFSNVS